MKQWKQSSFSNLSVISPTSQLILQPFRRFTYVTEHSPTLPLLHLRHSSFCNPSFLSSTSLVLHLRHLESRPCFPYHIDSVFKHKPMLIQLESNALRSNIQPGPSYHELNKVTVSHFTCKVMQDLQNGPRK